MAILEGGYSEGDTIKAVLKDPSKPEEGLKFERIPALVDAERAAVLEHTRDDGRRQHARRILR